jgi:hypothetical protein
MELPLFVAIRVVDYKVKIYFLKIHLRPKFTDVFLSYNHEFVVTRVKSNSAIKNTNICKQSPVFIKS